MNKPRTRKAEKELEQYHTSRFEEPRKMQNTSFMTEKHGVTVWPNVSLTQVELR